MVAIGIRRRKAVIGPNKLLRVFYRDGIFYFISLFVLAVLNIGIFLGAGPGRQLLFVQPLVNFSAILSSRMILHLRQWSAKQQIIVYSHNASTGERWMTQDTTVRRENFHSNEDGEYVMQNLVFKR
ncbi:hypothetical protein FA13DRAFT_1144567 [Coprinellus micaceus]|uniref:Uncharacterized protein n=1 Tax=Coprinellus micaceus TaxID=71717 RepID=A0A4Y7RJ70_COPMI|nr:hypothetical protein FA13DRAFT_1144567 [Coprinellus micaceus]